MPPHQGLMLHTIQPHARMAFAIYGSRPVPVAAFCLRPRRSRVAVQRKDHELKASPTRLELRARKVPIMARSAVPERLSKQTLMRAFEWLTHSSWSWQCPNEAYTVISFKQRDGSSETVNWLDDCVDCRITGVSTCRCFGRVSSLTCEIDNAGCVSKGRRPVSDW